jgi:D-beta-D-heptose 7-phosphate kinase/D-beta-D-heptose 1-phosphate adenosyltransferase
LKDNLINLVNNNFNAKNKWCLVIGDVMLDQYIFGDVDRISPEAPVPVLKKTSKIERIGGAGNVALNLMGLGVKAILVGEISNDISGKKLTALLKEQFISTQHLIKTKRPTTTKTRIMSGQQQVVRIDDEEPSSGISNIELKKILALLKNNPSAVIISDYEKGLLTKPSLQKIIQTAIKRKIPVLVDPKGKDLEKYRGATAITPNKKEALLLSNVYGKGEELLENSLKKLVKKYGFKFIAMTRGEFGIKYITSTKISNYPTSISRQVFDVSGAGDTVISTLAATIIAGASIDDSFKLANISAGIVIEKIGTMPINSIELLEELQSQKQGQENKIILKIDLLAKIKQLKNQNKKIGFTNGCFDILHAGHVTYLEKAKEKVDYLIVGMNTDNSVKKIKGPKRPVINETDRARILCSLESVDAVILFSESTPINLIKSLKPNLLIKGNDYSLKQIIGANEIKEWKGKVILIPIVKGKSTTKIINNLG